MSTQQRRADPSWSEKLWPYAKIVIPIVVAIWIFNIASGARQTAQTNAGAVSRLQVPQFELVLVPGGPDRFAETFEEILDEMDSAEAFDATQFLWSTYVVRNIGQRNATNVVFDVTAAEPIDHLLIKPPSYRNEATITHEARAATSSVVFNKLNIGDEALLFVGMTPQEFAQPYGAQSQRAWAQDFELYFEKFSVTSGKTEATLYSRGHMLAPALTAASQ
jgi:hypothetical protein